MLTRPTGWASPGSCRVTLPLSSSSSRTSKARSVTELTGETAVQSLHLLQEYFLQPWSSDVTPPKARVLRVVEEQLRRVTSEVVWRGLVATGLAGLLYSSWANAGTSQDSLFFYARLFGLLTPQASLAFVAALMLTAKLPFLWLSARPMALYTRLSSLEVKVVSRLTDTEWIVKIRPAATTEKDDSGSQDPTSSSSSSSSSTGREPPGQQLLPADGGEQQRQLARDDLDQRLKLLLAEVKDFTKVSTSSTGSTNGPVDGATVSAADTSRTSAAAASVYKAQESAGSELLAKLLQLGKDYAAFSAAAAAAARSSSRKAAKSAMKAAAKAAAKLAVAAELVLNTMNNSSSQRYVVVHVDSEDDDDASDDESADAVAAAEGESDDDDDDDEEEMSARAAAAAFKAKVQEKLAAQAQLRRKQQWDKQWQQPGIGDPPLLQTNKQGSLQGSQSDKLKRQMMRKMMKLAAGQLPRHRARTLGWYAAADVPTAQDAFAQWLLFLYGVLSELAPAGAFVATGGNAAAAAVASCCYNALAVTVNDMASQRARQQVRKALGDNWLLWLQPLQPSENR